jgi:hypothetical protein
MSKKTIDFGDDVCYYEDISDDSKLMYVKGCPSGTSCQPVNIFGAATDHEYNINTCQTTYSVSKREEGENCEQNLFECVDTLTCSNGKKCTSSSTSPGSSGCTTIIKTVDSGTEECVTDSDGTIGKKCYSKETQDSQVTTYTHYSDSRGCKKLQLGSNAGVYFIKSKELADLYSLEDGDYVEEGSNDYCKSGFSLFFFGNGGQSITPSNTEMYKRCVTVLAIAGNSGNYYIKYRIKDDGEEHIYDTSHLDSPYKSDQNQECDVELLMLKLELFKIRGEEYRNNGNSNAYIKWDYLYSNPKMYLLYKDQTDVLNYLIQKFNAAYIPEQADEPKPNTPPSQSLPTISSQTVDNSTVTTDTEKTGSSGLLNIKYSIILIFLFLF